MKTQHNSLRTFLQDAMKMLIKFDIVRLCCCELNGVVDELANKGTELNPNEKLCFDDLFLVVTFYFST